MFLLFFYPKKGKIVKNNNKNTTQQSLPLQLMYILEPKE